MRLRRCPFENLCGFSFHLKIGIYLFSSCCINCQCNYADCMASRSCCPDVIPADFFSVFESSNSTKSTGGQAATNVMDMQTVRTPKEIIDFMYETDGMAGLQCSLLHVKFRLEKVMRQPSALMYATCPLSTELALKTKCEQTYSFENINSIDDMVPVSVGLNLYRNKHCAECNNALSGFVQWNVSLTSSNLENTVAITNEEQFLQVFFQDNGQDINFVSPNTRQTHRSCLTVISSCNVTGNWVTYESELEGKCALYSNSVRTKEQEPIRYKNIFCAQCNGEYDQPTLCLKQGQTMSNPYPFSGLLAFSPLNTNKEVKDNWDSGHCKSHQIYDHTLVVFHVFLT